MSTLIIVEHNNQLMQASTRQVLAAALQLHENPTLLVVGYECQTVAEQAAELKGVGSVWLVDHPCYAHHLAENLTPLIVELSSSFSYILMASTIFGKNLLPRVAACVEVGLVSDVTLILDANTFERPIYAGNAIETVQILDDQKILSIRATAFDAILEQQPRCAIEQKTIIFEQSKTTFVNHQLNASIRPELMNAKCVVSGGRGMQSTEQFKLIEKLADVLGAAVGASRAAVDAGFVSNDYQVGQTGKVVAPDLYFAIGISGAVQHIAGMKDSKIIVAINKDADAPIFQVANYGLVGDLFVLIPELIEKLKEGETC